MNIELFRRHLSSQEFERKLNARIERLQKAELNPVERASILIDIQDDPILFMNLFGVVYEPRLPESPDIPMFPFPYQQDVVRKILDAEVRGHDLLIEKTRDMGITWTLIWYILWRWLTKDRYYALLGSRKEAEVDDKSPQSLFGKLRYALYSLPSWVRPTKFHKSENDIFMKLVNPDRMSYVDGESANENFGRGKRTSMVYCDELFFWRFARESWRSCIDTSPCRIGVSTPKASSFARSLRESMEQQGNLITLDWKLHPFKDEEWFKSEQLRRSGDELAVKAELEISYLSDPQYAYYPEVLRCPVVDLRYDENKPLYVGLDFGAHDKTAAVYFQRDTQKFYCIDGIERSNKKLSWYYPFIKHGIDFDKQDIYEIKNKFTGETFVLKKTDYSSEELEMIRRFNSWKQPVMYCGEVAHKQHMIKSNTSVWQELAGIGIMLRINDSGFAHSVRRAATKKMLERTVFANSGGALDVYDALANSHYPTNRTNSTSEESQDKPVHDEFADIRSAVENFAVNVITNQTSVKSFSYRRGR
jgi:hypothetical protein